MTANLLSRQLMDKPLWLPPLCSTQFSPRLHIIWCAVWAPLLFAHLLGSLNPGTTRKRPFCCRPCIMLLSIGFLFRHHRSLNMLGSREQFSEVAKGRVTCSSSGRQNRNLIIGLIFPGLHACFIEQLLYSERMDVRPFPYDSHLRQPERLAQRSAGYLIS